MLKPLPFTLLAAGAIALTACQTTSDSTPPSAGSSDPALPGAGVTVTPANSDWIQEQFTTEIVNIGLEDLGYEVERIQQADYAAILVSVANGDFTYTTGLYLPQQREFFENAGGDEALRTFDPLVPDSGQQGLMVDKATSDEYDFTNLEQLKDPELAAQFDTDGNGKANLIGCQTGWACSEAIDHQIEAYDLQDTVEQDQGQYSVMLADVLTRYNQDDSVLFFAYTPHWILSKLEPQEDVVWLEVPFTALPGELSDLSDADTTVDGRNRGLPANPQYILTSEAFATEHPAAASWFERVKVPSEDMDAESLRIEEGEDSAADVRRHAEAWVEENRDLVDGWLEEARQAADG
ncbi:MAG: glycine betaine/L-proline ABC transporter substrate-binding protein ProX [Cyanobacteria bacterium P01_A01_bin.135]